MRVNICAGITSQFVMSLIKWGAVAAPSLTPHGAYAWTMVGQLIGGVGQPLILNTLTRLTMDWYPNSERDIATTVAFQSAGLGVMFFAIVPPLMVHAPAQLTLLMLLQAVAWAAVTAVALLSFREAPDLPPSAAAAIQWQQRAEARDAAEASGHSSSEVAMARMWADFRSLWRNTNYMLLLVSFSLVQGGAYALPTLVGQFLEPCGYSNLLAGTAAALLASGGIVGNVLLAPIMQASKKYHLLQQLVTAATAAGVAALLLQTRPGDAVGVLMAWTLLGVVQGPLGPLTFEHGAELTFPISPENSITFLALTVNFIGFSQILALTPLLALPVSTSCETVRTPAAAVLMLFMLLGLLCVFFIREENRRADAEASYHAELEGDDGEAGGAAKAAGEATPLVPVAAKPQDQQQLRSGQLPAPPMSRFSAIICDGCSARDVALGE